MGSSPLPGYLDQSVESIVNKLTLSEAIEAMELGTQFELRDPEDELSTYASTAAPTTAPNTPSGGSAGQNASASPTSTLKAGVGMLSPQSAALGRQVTFTLDEFHHQIRVTEKLGDSETTIMVLDLIDIKV